MNKDRHRVVVIGGGYAGAMAATRAAGKARGRADVTLIDPDGVLVQRLRLHQVATGQKIAAHELPKLCGRRVSQVRGWAESIGLAEGSVRVRRSNDRASEQVPYDSLIVTTGSVVDTASVPGVAEHAHVLSGIESSQRLARDLEQAPAGVRIGVVGGGFTGIEAATEIAEARPDAKVSLVTRGGFGSRFSDRGRAHLVGVLDRLGVAVLDDIEVQAVAAGALEPSRGVALPFDLILWCGGFMPSPLAKRSGLAVGGRGGALVDGRMRSVSHPEVLVAGDAAEAPKLSNGAAVRMSCQAGIPTGAHAADVAAASLMGREEKDFDFGYLGWSVSLGRRDGLIQWVDRADRPRERVTRGRRAVWIKEMATASAAKSARWERRLPGAVRWPSAGRSQHELHDGREPALGQAER